MKKVILGLAFSIVCAFGLEDEEIIVAVTNGIMLGICAEREELIANSKVGDKQAKQAAFVKRFEMCRKIILKSQPKRYNKEDMQLVAEFLNYGLGLGRKFGESVLYDDLEVFSK